jgi:hypothetical protein
MASPRDGILDRVQEKVKPQGGSKRAAFLISKVLREESMSDEIQFAQTHFRDAIKEINPQQEPGLHALAQGLNLLAQAVAHLETDVEKMARASEYATHAESKLR